MSSSPEARSGEKSLGVRVDETTKRQVQMRVGQLGHANMSDYIRSLIDEDLDAASLPPLDAEDSG